MNMRLAHGPVRGRSFFPSAASAQRHIRYLPHGASPRHGARQSTRYDPARIAVVASWAAVAVIMALIVAAAVILPRPVPAATPVLPWNAATAGPVLHYEHSQVGVPAPLGVPHHEGGLLG